MNFSIFSTRFEVIEPIALIESYCFQSDFYANFDLLNYREGRKAKNVNAIGARMANETVEACEKKIQEAKELAILKYKDNLDGFLRGLKYETRRSLVEQLWYDLIEELDNIFGVSLATATKMLHTLYPEIIPMLDSLLQKEYRTELKRQGTLWEPGNILISYYNSLDENLENLNSINKELLSNNLIGLTRVRIFDIMCWSYLKSVSFRKEHKIRWETIKPVAASKRN